MTAQNTPGALAFTIFMEMAVQACAWRTQSIHSLRPKDEKTMPDRSPDELHNQGGRGPYRYNRGSPMVERTKNPQPTPRPKKQPSDPAENLTVVLSQKVV